MQACPTRHGWHDPPPQSRSVSFPFRIPSAQVDAKDGAAVGRADGEEDGETVGWIDVEFLADVGMKDGVEVGCADGEVVADVGAKNGVGMKDGAWVSRADARVLGM